MFDSYYNDVKRTHPELYAAYRDSLIKKALEILQNAQRYDVDPMGDYYQGEGMVHRDSGDWIAIDDVLKAIEILKDSK